MRCCFLPSKRRKPFSSEPAVNANDTIQQNPVLEESIHWISSESKDHQQQQECSDSLFSVSIGRGKPVSVEENAAETEVSSTPMQLRPVVPEPKQNSNEAKDGEDTRTNQSLLEYRYRDCYDDGYHDSHYANTEKESSESSESSLFSLSADFRNRKRVDNEVSSKTVALRGEEDEVLSVLNPIEKVGCQGKVKVVKEKGLNSIKKDKENINWIEQETSLKVSSSSSSKRKMKEEIAVDTSLSDWLVEPENRENIEKRGDVEDRAILRALTVEEIRKCSSVSKACSKSNQRAKDGKQDRSSTRIKSRQEAAFEGSVES